MLDEGDSISVFWGGNHTGIYAAGHPAITYHGQAVGGSGIDELNARYAADVAFHPAYVTVLIGANDLAQAWKYATTQDWLNALFAYTDRWRATGAKVIVGTVLAQQVPTQASNNPIHNARRIEANAAIRAAIGKHLDGVVDYAADPEMGTDAAPSDTALFTGGLHPTDGCGLGCGGQGKLAVIYTKALDQLMK